MCWLLLIRYLLRIERMRWLLLRLFRKERMCRLLIREERMRRLLLFRCVLWVGHWRLRVVLLFGHVLLLLVEMLSELLEGRELLAVSRDECFVERFDHAIREDRVGEVDGRQCADVMTGQQADGDEQHGNTCHDRRLRTCREKRLCEVFIAYLYVISILFFR